MDKPVLVVMAAGMGSRYGGLKQMDPMDDAGHVILDFSVYDAMLAGFEKVIFIIKKENEAEFRECVGDRIAKRMQVEYAYQELDALPEGYQAPEGRVKPFGTGHAVLSCKDKVNGPFAVINADDFYGRLTTQAILWTSMSARALRKRETRRRIRKTTGKHGSRFQRAAQHP